MNNKSPGSTGDYLQIKLRSQRKNDFPQKSVRKRRRKASAACAGEAPQGRARRKAKERGENKMCLVRFIGLGGNVA